MSIRCCTWRRAGMLTLMVVVLLAPGCRRSRPAVEEATETSAEKGLPSFSPSAPEGGPRDAVAVGGGGAVGSLPLMPEPARTVRVVQGAPSGGLVDYLDGLERLEAGQWTQAIAAFDRALEADGDNGRYHLARGVASTLAEQFTHAIEALERARRLDRSIDWEAKLWLASAYRMSGNVQKGAMLFSHGNAQTKHYANLVYNEMAMEYWQSKTQGQIYDAESRSLVPVQGAVKRKFAPAASWFVRQAKSTGAAGDVTALLFARGRERYDKGQYAEAMADLQYVWGTYPEDRRVLFYHAACSLGLGDAVTARQEFTRLLTFQTQNATAYLQRARASARLADSARTQADLASAARINPGEADKARSEIEQAVKEASANLPEQAPEALLAAVEEAVREGAGSKSCGERAQALHQVMNARRLHYDETYQDRLREHEDAVRAEPRSADAWSALGKFLYDESEVFGERVEPRGEARRFRYQTPLMARQEIERADRCLGQALRLDTKHLRALVARAALCFDQARYGDAEEMLLRAIDVRSDDPELLYLFSELRKYGAGWRAARASALRTPNVWSETQHSGDYIITTTYRRDPSQEDLRQADELQRQSNRLFALAQKYLERALQLSEGTPLGSYYRALVKKWEGDLPAAKQLLEEAIQQDPRLLRARRELIYVLDRLGRTEERIQQESDLLNQVETTAGSMLKLAWRRMMETAWVGAGQALTQARKLDPADARIPAYRAVIALAQKKPAEARQQLQVALALEEARMNLRGTTLQEGGSGILRPEDAGLTLVLRNRLGQQLLLQKQAEEAAEVFRANAALQTRLSRRDWTTEMPRAMLPEPSQEPHQVPPAENVMALLAWSRLGLGQAYLALGRLADAERELQAVRSFESGLMATESGRERLREPVARASMGLCRLELARGNTEAAFNLITRLGRPWGLSPEADREWKLLENEVMQARRGGR